MRTSWIISLSLLSGAAWAQIDTRISPAPAPPQETAPSEAPSKWTGTPLTGFLSETVGSTLKQGLETSVAVSGSATNQFNNTPGNPYGVDESTQINGTVSLHHDWSRSTMLLQYAGGTGIDAKNSYYNRQFHQFAASEAMKVSRWNLSLNQQYSYLPQSNYGFDAAQVLGNGLSGAGGTGTNLFLPPNVIQRSAAGQVTASYMMVSRSTISFSGGFSDQHFSGTAPGAVLADSEGITAGADYSYALGASDSIGMGYNFLQGRGIGFGSLIQSHSALANYTHKLGNRLTLHASAGPQFTTFNQNGIENNLGASVQVNAGAAYELGRTSFGANYFRGVNPGAGLFLGSQSETVAGYVSRLVGRSLHVSAGGGYSRNSNLNIPSINTVQGLDSTYMTVSAERNFGPMISGYMSYTLQNQNTNQPLCNAGVCTAFPMFHTGIIGVRFHIHPLTLKP